MGLVRPVAEVDESVWGKAKGLDAALPPYPLVRHLLDAAAMALFLWDEFLSGNQRAAIAEGLALGDDVARARQLVGLCAGLHDIGKVSGFQFCDRRAEGYLSGALKEDRAGAGAERLSHDLAGMRAVPAVLAALGLGSEPAAKAVCRVAEIVGGHHGRFHRYVKPASASSGRLDALLGGWSWARQREAHAAAVVDALGGPELPEAFSGPAAVLVTGLVILADWLVSQEDYLRRRQRRPGGLGSLADHFAQSRADASGLVREAGLLPVSLTRKAFAEAYGIDGEPNPLQRSIAEELPVAVARRRGGAAGILLVTAAPGDGKSEAALEAERIMSVVFGTHGFAFLLPTMATSDQMHGRVAGVLDRQHARGAGLTLTHSMAWLSSAYADQDLAEGSPVLVCDGEEEGAGRADSHQAHMRPRRWLRGSKRSLLAQYAVGTIDQALMAVLPVRHNALRLLALSGKTLIVDEAHAYDPYMQVLLGRLLCWLGRYGVPVVLLSATLPASVSDRLIKEYLRGAGRKPDKALSFRAPYPGWLYVDAATGEQSCMSPSRQEAQAAERRMELRVETLPVVHGEGGGERNRLAVIRRLLEPALSEDGGSVIVVCNTVNDAQQTYTHLRSLFAQRGLAADDLLLLHARLPGDAREERTAKVTDGMGRHGPRPARRVIVATQVVEQSLDLDADLVISDLAPLALLLQRAGRCWRHESWWATRDRPADRVRPAWAAGTGARLVVLDPLLDGGSVPKQWGTVYHEVLLAETSDLLAARGDRPVRVPEDVQDLVEQVHGDRPDRFDWEATARQEQWSAYLAENMAQRSTGAAVAVCRPSRATGLHKLHHLQGLEDEWEAATRLGADSVRLLCVYRHPGGVLTLDPAGRQELPMPAQGASGQAGRMALADVRLVMHKTIPVNADWFRKEREVHLPPPEWREHPMLGDLVVLALPVQDGQPCAVTVDGASMSLDRDLGLVVRR